MKLTELQPGDVVAFSPTGHLPRGKALGDRHLVRGVVDEVGVTVDVKVWTTWGAWRTSTARHVALTVDDKPNVGANVDERGRVLVPARYVVCAWDTYRQARQAADERAAAVRARDADLRERARRMLGTLVELGVAREVDGMNVDVSPTADPSFLNMTAMLRDNGSGDPPVLVALERLAAFAQGGQA